MILPETDAEAARKIAERGLRLIEGLQIPHEGSAICKTVTASMGVGTIIPGVEADQKTFIDDVDKLLYKAKKAGRNRVERASF